MSLPRQTSLQYAQTDSFDQLHKVSHTSHFRKGAFRNLLKQSRLGIHRTSFARTMNFTWDFTMPIHIGRSLQADSFVIEHSLSMEIRQLQCLFLVSRHSGVQVQKRDTNPSVSASGPPYLTKDRVSAVSVHSNEASVHNSHPHETTAFKKDGKPPE